MSGSGVKGRSYFTVAFCDDNDDIRLYASSLTANGLTGIWFNDLHEEALAATIPNSSLPKFRLRIDHYADELIIRYNSSIEFMIHQALRVAWYKVRLERFRQAAFNKKTLVRSDRMAVLRAILEETISRHEYQASFADIMNKYYGPRCWRHPNNNQLIEYYNLLLGSLAETGELERDGIAYKLLPKALDTVAQHELEEQRHRDQVNTQRWLTFLTAGLVVVGVVQISDKLPDTPRFDIRIALGR